MAYFKINGVDFSHCVSSLKISKDANYNAQTNAAGNTVVDYINTKRTIEVGIIALDDTAMSKLQTAIDAFNVSISYRNPKTNVLEEGVNCIIPKDSVDYYTIQTGKVLFRAMTLTFTEL
jgi:hypothetical protein